MSDGKRFPLEEARAVAEGIKGLMATACARIEIAGSIRRQKPDVGDIELLYIPLLAPEDTGNLFQETRMMNLADERLDHLLHTGVIEERLNAKGSTMWGQDNKLAVHLESGINVDFFSADEENWFNRLVCRTGGKNNNQRIAMAAQKMEMTWKPYGSGFLSHDEGMIVCKSEEDVFKAVCLPYLPPEKRT